MPRCYFSTDASAPSTMLRFWQQQLGEDRVAELTMRVKNLLAQACLGYVLRIYKFTDMLRLLRDTPVTSDEIRKLRQAIMGDYRMVLGLKMVIIRCQARVMQGLPRRIGQEIAQVNEQIRLLEKRVGVQNTEDGLLLPTDRALYRNLGRMQLREPLIKLLPELPVETIPAVAQVVQQCGEFLAEQEGWINRFVFRKLRFVRRSQNMHPHDIASELYFKAICTFYYYTPFRTPAHRANSVKRAIHHYGMQIIDHYGSKHPENCRLRQDHNGDWYNLIRTDSQIFGGAIKSMDSIYHPPEHITRASYDIGLASFSRVDNSMVIENFVAQRGPMAERILQLLSMRDDDEFIEFIKRQNGNMEGDNEVIYQTLGRRRYFGLIAEYLQVPLATVKSYVSELRELLGS